MYRIPNIDVHKLCFHTRAYLNSIGKIPVIYQIQISQASQRKTQPYGDDETHTSNIYDLIIDTISDICQPIADIVHFETFEDPEFQNLLDFPEGDSAFFEFPKTQEGGCGAHDPPKNNPPLASIPFL